VLARDQQSKDLEIGRRLRPAHTLNRFRAALPEVSQQRREKFAIQLLAMTRSDGSAGRVS
jgi:hypothetical protein